MAISRTSGEAGGPLSTRRVRRNIARSERSELRVSKYKRSSPGRGEGKWHAEPHHRIASTGVVRHPIQGFGILSSNFPELHCASLRAIFLCPSGAFLEAK
jgi:hypothetical protein